MNRRTFLIGASAAILESRIRFAGAALSRCVVFFGTRGGAKGQGIYSCFFDSETVTCSSISLVSDLASPTSLAVSTDTRYLYSVSEVGNEGKSDGSLAAFEIDRGSGNLKLLDKVSSGGGGPTSIRLDHTGKTALVANFGSGRTTAFRVLSDGKLGRQTASMQDYGTGPHRRQSAPHAHAVVVSPDNRFVLTADFGADRVFIFRFEAAAGALTAQDPPFVQMPAGSGPRQMAFHPNGKFVYLLSELTAVVTVFSWNAGIGHLSQVQTISSLASDNASEPSGAGLIVHPSGRFLYTTTRNDSSVNMFAVDSSTGTLAARQRVSSSGKTPWGCAFDPAGRYLFAMNQASDSVAIFRIDSDTGELQSTAPVLNVSSPVSAVFVPV